MNSRRRARLIAWTMQSMARSSSCESAGTVADRSIKDDDMVMLTLADHWVHSRTEDSPRILPNLYNDLTPSQEPRRRTRRRKWFRRRHLRKRNDASSYKQTAYGDSKTR